MSPLAMEIADSKHSDASLVAHLEQLVAALESRAPAKKGSTLGIDHVDDEEADEEDEDSDHEADGEGEGAEDGRCVLKMRERRVGVGQGCALA